MSSPGVEVNHALDGQTQTAKINWILSVCCSLITVMVALRVYTRTCIINSFGADDAAIVIAQILGVGAAVVIGLEGFYGLGRHIWTVKDMSGYLKTFYASVLIYNSALIAVKLSFLLMYRRIFVTPKMRWATLIGIFIIAAWGIANITSLSMICLPIQKLWDHEVHGRCMNLVPAFFAPAVINMITDFGIFLLPLPAIRKLNLPRRQKIILVFILCLGLFTCVISIIRLCTLDSAATSPDATWSNTGAALWSYLELTVAVTAACLPCLRPLAGQWFPRFFHHTSSHRSPGHTQPHDGSDGKGHNNKRGHIITWGSLGKHKHHKRLQESSDILVTGEVLGMAGEMAALNGVITPPAAVVAGSENYKVSVGSQNANDSNSTLPPVSKEEQEELQHEILATTVIKQEYQRS